MIKFQKYFLIIIILIISLMGVQGQNPMGLYFMETIPQSSQLNPAMQPRANKYFSLPSVNFALHSDLAFKDAFQNQGSEWVTPLSERFDYDDFYKTTGKAINLNNSVYVDILGLGFRSGRDYFSLTLSVKNVLQGSMPSDFFKITEKGFPHGESFDFSTFRIKEVAYHEVALGYSREWDDQFTFGVKLKPLFGIAGGYSDINRFQLNTSRKSWDLMVDGTVHSSAPLEVEEGEPGEFPASIDKRELSSNEERKYFSSLSNGGLAFDFGAVYDYDEEWTFSAAFNNLGYVRFKNDLNSLSFNGTYSFQGVEVESTNEDEIDQAFDDVMDSLETVIEYDVQHEKFSVPLTPTLFMGASYQWTPAVSFGLLSGTTFQKHNFRQDFSLSANIQPYSFVAVNLNYRKQIRGGNGLGTALSVLAGPLQIFMAADYLPIRYAPVTFDDGDSFPMLHRQKDLSFRFGLNLIFGRHGNRDEPMLSIYDCPPGQR